MQLFNLQIQSRFRRTRNQRQIVPHRLQHEFLEMFPSKKIVVRDADQVQLTTELIERDVW